jgi:hypothetical protein
VAGQNILNPATSGARPTDASFHHGSHQQLLTRVSVAEAPLDDVDAVIVPTARPVDWLREAMNLAQGLGCGLVALCSGHIRASEAADLGDEIHVPVIAVDVSDDDYGLPEFSTSQQLSGSIYERKCDTSTKRNMGLLLSRVAGWTRVFFIDDDIHHVEPKDVHAAVGLLQEFDAVGLDDLGFPDNSVVCHAYSVLGNGQAQFIGGGGMALNPLKARSFFPDIYNDDWLFFLADYKKLNLAVVGSMHQKRYDPFANSDRARDEELGDCLAEGLYWLLDHQRTIKEASLDHWRDFLGRREYFVDELIDQVGELDIDRTARRRMLRSLQVARATRELITPGLCAEYVRHWQSDLASWRRFVARRPRDMGVDRALEHLSWPGVVRSELPWLTKRSDGLLPPKIVNLPGWA